MKNGFFGFFLLLSTATLAQRSNTLDFCGLSNDSYAVGEVVKFKIFYNLIGLYVDAGSASFTVNDGRVNGRPAYHVVGLGSSNPSYDWIFRVRDRYESYIDTSTLKPLRFIRHVEEGGYRKDEYVNFDRESNRATSMKGKYTISECMQDVLSSVYYARNLDFERYKPGQKINFSMFLDDEIHNIYIRYMGKEVIKTRYGTFNAIKFKPMLIKGTLFEGGELMTVWVSDDRNHIPLRVESPITVGSVKVDMMGYRNLRHPFHSLISSR